MCRGQQITAQLTSQTKIPPDIILHKRNSPYPQRCNFSAQTYLPSHNIKDTYKILSLIIYNMYTRYHALFKFTIQHPQGNKKQRVGENMKE
jgi:hypothetical protein